jgi:hypothetical protein
MSILKYNPIFAHLTSLGIVKILRCFELVFLFIIHFEFVIAVHVVGESLECRSFVGVSIFLSGGSCFRVPSQCASQNPNMLSLI